MLEGKSGNNSPKKMMSMLMQSSNEQQIINQASPFESVYDFYKRDQEEIKQLLIGEINDPLTIAKQFALLALDQTRTLLPIGRGNIYEDITKSEGLSHLHTRMVRDLLKYSTEKIDCPVKKNVKKGYLSVAKKRGVPEKLQTMTAKTLTDLLVRSHLALHYQAGNCNEYSFIALQCLFELKRKLGDDFNNFISNMRVMKSESPEYHVFVELDVKMDDQTTTIICDPWAGFVGKIEDAPENFRVAGKKAEEIYGENATPLLIAPLVQFAFEHITYANNDLSCFDMYHQAKIENIDDPYYTFLCELPEHLTPEYQKDTCIDYIIHNGTVYDYEGNSQRALQHLIDRVDPENVPSFIEGRTVEHPFYSQPNHTNIRLQPIFQFVDKINDIDIDHEEKMIDQNPTLSIVTTNEDKSSEQTITNDETITNSTEQTRTGPFSKSSQ